MSTPHNESFAGFDLTAERITDDDGHDIGVSISVAREFEIDGAEEPLFEHIGVIFVGAEGCVDIFVDNECELHFCDFGEMADFTAMLKHCECIAHEVATGGEDEVKRDVN